jgi:hypothetical protein
MGSNRGDCKRSTVFGCDSIPDSHYYFLTYFPYFEKIKADL